MVVFEYLDKRVQRTKLDLHHALMELLKQKKYDQITIKDITDYAGYSRGSFYNNYKHKDDLLNELIDFLFKEASIANRTSYINEDCIDIQRLNNEPIFILKHFKQYGEFYQILLGKNMSIDFRDKLTNMFVDLFQEDFEMQDTQSDKNIDKNLISKYYAYGTIGLILEWILVGFPTEPEEFSKELVKTFKYPLRIIQIKNKRKRS